MKAARATSVSTLPIANNTYLYYGFSFALYTGDSLVVVARAPSLFLPGKGSI